MPSIGQDAEVYRGASLTMRFVLTNVDSGEVLYYRIANAAKSPTLLVIDTAAEVNGSDVIAWVTITRAQSLELRVRTDNYYHELYSMGTGEAKKKVLAHGTLTVHPAQIAQHE